MTEESNLKIKDGQPWTKVGVFHTFKEADKCRWETSDRESTFRVKVKRLAKGFKVVKREEAVLAKLSKEIDETLQKKNKPSKRSRK